MKFDERLLELIHGEVDGVNTPVEQAELERLAAGDKDARCLREQMLALAATIKDHQVRVVTPPDLRRRILQAVREVDPGAVSTTRKFRPFSLSQVFQSTYTTSLRIPAMKNKTIIAAAAFVAVIIIVVLAVQMPWPPKDATQGTIGAAQKYRSEQVTDKDVVVGGGATSTGNAEASASNSVALFDRASLDRQLTYWKSLPAEKQAEALKDVSLDKQAEYFRTLPADKQVEYLKSLPAEIQTSLFKNIPSGKQAEFFRTLPAEKQAEYLKNLPAGMTAGLFKNIPSGKQAEFFRTLPAEKQAEYLKNLPAEKTVELLKNIPAGMQASAFKTLPVGQQAELLKNLPVGAKEGLFKSMPVEKQVELFKTLPGGRQADILGAMPSARQTELLRNADNGQ